MSKRRRIMFILAGVVSMIALAGATANAVASTQTGTQTNVQIFAGESSPWTSPTIGAWSNVATAAVSVTVPAGTTRFVNARFTTESLCIGSAGGWCSVRVVYVNSAGTTVELNPVVGTDYKFDTPDGAEQACALERFSPLLGPGTYTVRVQALRMTGITQFTLDDYAFAVGVVAP